LVSKESLTGKQRSNRIADLAWCDAASLGLVELTIDHGSGRGSDVIEARRRQRSFGDGLIAEEIEDLQETWMRHVNVVLQDEEIVSARDSGEALVNGNLNLTHLCAEPATWN
jgi:hypothetical protein